MKKNEKKDGVFMQKVNNQKAKMQRIITKEIGVKDGEKLELLTEVVLLSFYFNT